MARLGDGSRWSTAAIVLGLVVVATTTSDASGAFRTHDRFYLRMLFGGGYTNMKANSKPETTLDGGSMWVSVALGGEIGENLILYGETFGTTVFGPTLRYGEVEQEADEDVATSYSGIGPGIAYYFMPANLYVSGTATLAKMTLKQDNERIAETEMGFGLNAVIGKEWWISDNWGLGLAVGACGGWMNDQGGSPRWSVYSVNVGLSGTYN